MLLKPDCIPCILKMTISCLRKLPLDENSIKALYAEIDKKQVEMDKKWDEAVGTIREEWAKKMAAQLREKFEKEREQLEKDMDSNLDWEWEKMKGKIREEWEKQK